MAENGNSQPKRRVISFEEFIEVTQSGEPLRFDSEEILKETDLRELFKEQDKEYDDERLVDKIKFLHGEIKSKEGQVKELERTRDESLDILRGFVGEKLADRIRDLPDSLKRLVGYVKTMSDSYKSLKSHLTDSQEQEKSRLQVAQDVVNSFFLSFGHIADPAEEKEAYRLLGQPVERMLSSDGAERLSDPDETMKVTINDSQLADAVLAKVAKNYDRLFSSVSSNAAVLKSSIEVLRQELEKRGLGSNEIDALLKKAEATALNKPMELRRQIDETVDKMSKEEIAIKFNQLKQELAQTVKDKAAIEEQKKALESRRSDVYAVIKELNEIDIILEKSDLYTCNPMSGLGLSSSKIIESIPFELSKRRTALADIVAESLKLQKLVDEKDKLIAENSKLISSQKDELQKRKVLFVPDPVLRSIYSRFVLAHDVNMKYAAANSLPNEALPGFTVNSEVGVSVLIDNYLTVLAKMKDSVLVDIVADENHLWDKYDKLKLEGNLKKKKDVQLLRKYVSALISSEAGRVARNIQSVK